MEQDEVCGVANARDQISRNVLLTDGAFTRNSDGFLYMTRVVSSQRRMHSCVRWEIKEQVQVVES